MNCPRAKSSMTPCVLRNGSTALADNGKCVGCGWTSADAIPNEIVPFEAQKVTIQELQAENSRLKPIIDQAGELSTGWKHGNEGVHLLKIQSLLSGQGECK